MAGVALALGGIVWWFAGREPSGGGQQQLTAQQALSVLQDIDLAKLEAEAAANPNDPAMVFNLGMAYMDRQRWGDALEVLSRYRNMDPANITAQIEYGIASMNVGIYGPAEETFLAVLVKDPDNVQVHYSLGFLYANAPLPSPTLARQHWEAVVRLSPDSRFAADARVRLQSLPQ